MSDNDDEPTWLDEILHVLLWTGVAVTTCALIGFSLGYILWMRS